MEMGVTLNNTVVHRADEEAFYKLMSKFEQRKADQTLFYKLVCKSWLMY